MKLKSYGIKDIEGTWVAVFWTLPKESASSKSVLEKQQQVCTRVYGVPLGIQMINKSRFGFDQFLFGYPLPLL